MVTKNNSIGSFLQKQRIANNLTQKQLAKEFELSSTQFISNWERGLCLPPASYLPKLCQLLNIEKEILINLILAKTEADLDYYFTMTQKKDKKNGTK